MGIAKYVKEIQEYDVVNEVFCPLTGEKITDEDDYTCWYADCGNVDPKKEHSTGDSKYRCPLQLKQIKDIVNRMMKESEKRLRHQNGYDASEGYDCTYILDKCVEYHKLMLDNKKNYKDMVIEPFREDNERHIILSFEEERVTKVVKTENIFQALHTIYHSFEDKNLWSVSIVRVDAAFADILQVFLCIQYGLNAGPFLKIENPIYIKSKDVYKYVDIVYGLAPHQFRKILSKNLWITETVNCGNIIYIKQELDKAIRQEAKLKR